MLKVLEVNINMASTVEGSTATAIEAAAKTLPKCAKLVSTCATSSVVYLFFELAHKHNNDD